VAAPTTSLPEVPGGEGNFDYRFAWLRDAAMIANALSSSTCSDESIRYFDWMTQAATACREADQVQIVFGVGGERDLSEHPLDHLEGHLGSRPVPPGGRSSSTCLGTSWTARGSCATTSACPTPSLRSSCASSPTGRRATGRSGTRASGKVARASATMWSRRFSAGSRSPRDRARRPPGSACRSRPLVPRARQDPDGGSAAWLAGGPRGLHGRVRVATPGRRRADASARRVRRAGRPAHGGDRRHARAGAARRRPAGTLDGRGGRAFLLASFWLAEYHARAGHLERAQAIFERAAGTANDVGLLAEEVDVATGEPLGNMPQAIAHVGLVNAAAALTEAEHRQVAA
jgi:alpha,alpha-trehalase